MLPNPGQLAPPLAYNRMVDRTCFSQMLVDLRDRDGLTIVLVDQEIRQALKIADYVYVLELGRNKFEGPVEEFTDLEKAFWVG